MESSVFSVAAATSTPSCTTDPAPSITLRRRARTRSRLVNSCTLDDLRTVNLLYSQGMDERTLAAVQEVIERANVFWRGFSHEFDLLRQSLSILLHVECHLLLVPGSADCLVSFPQTRYARYRALGGGSLLVYY